MFPVFAGPAYGNLEITTGRQFACLLIPLLIIRLALIAIGMVRVRRNLIVYTIEDNAPLAPPHFPSQYLAALTAGTMVESFNHKASNFIEGKVGTYFGERPRAEEGALRDTARRFSFSRRGNSQNKQYRRNNGEFHDLSAVLHLKRNSLAYA